MRLPLLVSVTLVCLLSNTTFGQDSSASFNKIINFPNQVLEKINKKAIQMENKLVSKTDKALRRLGREESRLKQKLARIDSAAAGQLFSSSLEKLQQLQKGLKQASEFGGERSSYLPYLDTIKTSLAFISQLKMSQGGSGTRAADVLANVKKLDSRFQQAEAIKKYLKSRRQYLKEQLGKLGMINELKRYNKEVYYYAEQVKEYKNILQDPQKLEKKALGLLAKLPIFQKFLQEHSELAGMFGMPDNIGSYAQLTGMQTRASVQQLVQQNLGISGPNVQNMVRQNLQQGQNQLNQLKDQMYNLGGLGRINSTNDFEMPDFKPNSQRTKMFWDRIEYGANIQSVKATTFWPVTTDIGVQAGYRLTDGAVIGGGISYRVGLGKDIRRITISQEGIGLRSYIDWKIKGKMYISGGYEQNYRLRFDNIQQLNANPQNWQQSGLIGLSRKYKAGKKLKGDMKILYDFLYKTHSPVSQAVIFRVGYNF